MPTYEYECNACGHHFERFQSMTDRPLSQCPECDGQVRRLIGAGAGFIIKGAGSHETASANTPEGIGAGLGPDCGRARPCCGRGTPCERSPRGD